MYCKHCGKQIQNPGRFCPFCGGSIDVANSAASKTQANRGDSAALLEREAGAHRADQEKRSAAPAEGVTGGHQKSHAAMLGIPIAAVLVVAVVAVILVRFLWPDKPKTLKDTVTNYMGIPGNELRYGYDEDGELMFILGDLKYQEKDVSEMMLGLWSMDDFYWTLASAVMPDGDNRVEGSEARLLYFEDDELVKIVTRPGDEDDEEVFESDGKERSYQVKGSEYKDYDLLDVDLDEEGKVIAIRKKTGDQTDEYKYKYDKEGNIISCEGNEGIWQAKSEKNEEGQIARQIWTSDENTGEKVVSEISYCTLPEEDNLAGIWECTGQIVDGESQTFIEGEMKPFFVFSANGYGYMNAVSAPEELYGMMSDGIPCFCYNLSEDALTFKALPGAGVDFPNYFELDGDIKKGQITLTYTIDGVTGAVELTRID